MQNNLKFEIATLAGGCFWCLEAVYQNLKGVGVLERPDMLKWFKLPLILLK